MNVHDDERAWFRANPSRSYRCRLASPAELDTLREAGSLDGMTLPFGCFIFAMFHIDRKTTTLDGRLTVLEAGPTWNEAACLKAWQDCEQAERARQ